MKKIVMIMMVLFTVLTLSGCGNEESENVTSLEIRGISSTVVRTNDLFNVLDGVTVVGDNGVDYTEFVRVSSSKEETLIPEIVSVAVAIVPLPVTAAVPPLVSSIE